MTTKEILEQLNELRDDAPMYPFWTVGGIKALIAQQVKEAKIEMLKKLKHLDDESRSSSTMLPEILEQELAELEEKADD